MLLCKFVARKAFVKNVKFLLQKKVQHDTVIRFISHHTTLKPRRTVTEAESEEMMQYFPDIVKDLTLIEDGVKISMLTKRITDLLEYTVPNGSKILGYSEVLAYKMLEKPERLTKENLKLAIILGWCMELHATSLLIADDIVDDSETRRGEPCWHKLPNIGLSAINDSGIVSQAPFILLKKYFSTHKCYVPMMELMNTSFLNVAIGIVSEATKVNIKDITMERYLVQEKYKSAEYTFTTPVTLAMHLSDVYSENLFEQCRDVFMEMGLFFSRENDMCDIFADPSTTGRIGSDIKEGKCTWIVATALQKANASHRKVLEQHHGKQQKESVEMLRNLYEELDIPKEFFAYRDLSYRKVLKDIKVLNHERMRNCLHTLTDRLYERKYD